MLRMRRILRLRLHKGNMMTTILMCSLMLGVGQPPADAPQKKQDPQGNNDLQKLTPAILNDMARRIETALVDDTVTGTLSLKVTVEDQVLVINGEAPDEAARRRASDIATAVAGDELYRITNRVRIRPAGAAVGTKQPGVTNVPTGPDLAQVERVDSLLREKLPELARTIRTRFRAEPMPCIVLEGVVDTMEQKLEISRAVRAEIKSLPLLNNITLRIKPNMPQPRPVADTKQPRQVGGSPPNKAVAIDADTKEDDVPLAGTIAQRIMADARIFDTVVLIQADGGLVWLKGTVETFPMKVRCVNLATRAGASYVIDDLTVATALRGAQELSVAKQKGATTAGEGAIVDEDSIAYFRRNIGEFVPVPGAYTIEAKEGAVSVSLRAGVLTPEQIKRVSEAAQKMAADLGVKAVIDVRPATPGGVPAPGGGGAAPPPPTPPAGNPPAGEVNH